MKFDSMWFYISTSTHILMDYKINVQIMDYIGQIDEKFKKCYLVPVRHYINGIGIPELIIENKQLRFSRIDQMRNDSEEGKYVCNLFLECVSELLAENSITADEFELLNECVTDLDRPLLYSVYDGKFESKRVDATAYVACFTTARTAEMWSEYSSGAAIELWMTDDMLRGVFSDKESDFTSYFRIYKVQYGSPEFKAWMKGMILDAKNLKDNGVWIQLVHELLVRSHIAVKDPKFMVEDELRLVFYKPDRLTIEDPLCKYLCHTHVDLVESEQVINQYVPESDEYVWIDISTLLTSAVINGYAIDEGWIKIVAGDINVKYESEGSLENSA